MNETAKAFVENPIGTIVFFSCLGIFIWVISSLVPNPISKLQILLKVILKEFDPKSQNNWVERINLLSIVLFGLIFILLLLIIGGGAFFKEIFNVSTPKNYFSLSIISLILLFLVVIYSPLLIIFSNKDRAIAEKGEKLLKSID